jgi:hypothetical protein
VRKRSKYRPKPIAVDPIAYAIAGARPVSGEKRLKVKAARDMTLIAYAEGRAVERDLAILEGALALARELARDGIGIELLAICDRAKFVLAAQRDRLESNDSTIELGRGDFDLMREMCELLDLQCQVVPLSQYEVCQRRAMHRCSDESANRIRSGHPANKIVA